MPGDSSASPAAITRIAASSSQGGVSLSTKPLAPALSAAKTYSSRWNVVRISTPAVVVAGSPVICRVASMPSCIGILMSIKMTSGISCRASVTAWLPVPASPTVTRSGSLSSRIRKLARSRAWSSATRTRIGAMR